MDKFKDLTNLILLHIYSILILIECTLIWVSLPWPTQDKIVFHFHTMSKAFAFSVRVVGCISPFGSISISIVCLIVMHEVEQQEDVNPPPM